MKRHLLWLYVARLGRGALPPGRSGSTTSESPMGDGTPLRGRDAGYRRWPAPRNSDKLWISTVSAALTTAVLLTAVHLLWRVWLAAVWECLATGQHSAGLCLPCRLRHKRGRGGVRQQPLCAHGRR